MKKTTQKQKKILSVLQKSKEALTAAGIHKMLPHIDLATVYRSVDKFSEDGTIKKLVLDGTKAVYEYTEDPHHHAVCADCEDIIHFYVNENELKKTVVVPGFKIDDIEIIVRGKHITN